MLEGVAELFNSKEVTAEQPAKILCILSAAKSGSIILVRLLQSLKALSAIVVTELGISIDSNFEHPANAFLPIAVTDFDMTMQLRLVQSLKALSAIVITESGMETAPFLPPGNG